LPAVSCYPMSALVAASPPPCFRKRGPSSEWNSHGSSSAHKRSRCAEPAHGTSHLGIKRRAERHEEQNPGWHKRTWVDEEGLDEPIFTKRHMMMVEQGKQAQLAQLEETIKNKDHELHCAKEDNRKFREMYAQREKQCGSTCEENKILKRAVTILNKRVADTQHEGDHMKQQLQQAAEYIKTLEQRNYNLARMQQDTGMCMMGGPPPPPAVH